MVLRLSVNSFHYKTVKYVMGEEYFLYRLSLCKYFWTLVFSTLMMPLFLAGRSLQKVRWPHVEVHWPIINIPKQKRKLYFAIGYGGLMVATTVQYVLQHMYYMILLNVFLVWVVFFSSSTFKLFSQWQNTRPPKPIKIPKPKKPREPNLAWEYVKARKQKICPYIVWEDR